jgi:iron-sulfur-dependent L-serine dehydratase beta subunit
MKTVSIFNHVLGPVMRGPSSSHTAGAFHIGLMARSILGGAPRRAVLAFDPSGSYAATYLPQGADRGVRCTSKGGLAVTPSAKALKPGCCGSGCGTCP